MTLYTAYPIEEVLKGAEDQIVPLEDIEINGVLFQVRRNGNQAVIERLISADLNHYLNPAYSPGQMIHLKPSL